MLLYTLYNADLIDLPDNPEAEDALGYMDDIEMIASGIDLIETTNHLQDICLALPYDLYWLPFTLRLRLPFTSLLYD